MSKERFLKAVEDLERRVIMPNRPPSLLPVLEGIKDLGVQYDPAKVIVVAGTNGKGSTCATLETLLMSAGKRVGFYSSPHLVETTERIRLQGENVSYDLFCDAYDVIKKHFSTKTLSHFEVLTLMALHIFLQSKLDYMIFEVGLGGTWDATNAVEHNTSCITSLGLDHQDILGESLWEIAKNKLGIVREADTKHRVVHAPWPAEVKKLIEGFVAKSKARFRQSEEFKYFVEENGMDPQFFVKTKWGTGRLRLPGERGAQNSVVALTLFEELGFNPAEHMTAIERVQWPGRMDYREFEGRRIYFSGDHNPQGVFSLKEILKHYEYENLYALVGVGKSKDFRLMLNEFLTIPRIKLVLTETPFRGLNVSEYGDFSAKSWKSEKDPQNGLNEILKSADPKDLILVSGSLYLVGEIMKKVRLPNW